MIELLVESLWKIWVYWKQAICPKKTDGQGKGELSVSVVRRTHYDM